MSSQLTPSDTLLDAIGSPDDIEDIEVYRLLILFLETLSDSEDIPNRVVRCLRLYRPGVVKMLDNEVNSIEIAELLRVEDNS